LYNKREIQNARLILKMTNQNTPCTN